MTTLLHQAKRGIWFKHFFWIQNKNHQFSIQRSHFHWISCPVSKNFGLNFNFNKTSTIFGYRGSQIRMRRHKDDLIGSTKNILKLYNSSFKYIFDFKIQLLKALQMALKNNFLETPMFNTSIFIRPLCVRQCQFKTYLRIIYVHFIYVNNS